MRKELETQVEARAQAMIKQVETTLKADAAKKLKAATHERAEEVAGLKAELRDARKYQAVKESPQDPQGTDPIDQSVPRLPQP